VDSPTIAGTCCAETSVCNDKWRMPKCRNLLPVMMMQCRALKASSSVTFQSWLSPFHHQNVELL
jgi:hypothetical protein